MPRLVPRWIARRLAPAPDGSAATSPLLRLVSVIVLIAFTALTITASLITRNVVHSQDRLILRERTAEVATLAGELFTSVLPAMQLVGTIARLEPGNTQQFVETARGQATTGSFMVATRRGSGFVITSSAGHDPIVGTPVTGAWVGLAARAESVTGLVTGFIGQGTRQQQLVIALGGAAGPGTVVFENAPISPTTPVPSTASSPFRALNIALYMGTTATPSALIITTVTHLPLTGTTVVQRLPVGADTWLLVAGSRGPLVGSLVWDMPWILLILGLLGAALMTSVVETLARRRVYASKLVAERTASLRTAMAELERSKDELVRHERLAAVGELASSVGHELRNPLGVLMNVIYLMEAGIAGTSNDNLRSHLATAKREVSAATLIVSDLLDYASARGPITAPVEIAELMAETLSVLPSPNGIEVVDDCDAQVVIDVDRDQIRQVLLNLISNAYDAMPAGGVLTVAANAHEGTAHISVSDSGIGMDEETRRSIFLPFFSKKARGIGLGLSVTKRIIESHGGTISVQSAPAGGSSFVMELPCVAAMASAPA